MTDKQIMNCLQKGDVSIHFHVHRDLLGLEKRKLQQQIESEGCGVKFLSKRKLNGHWDRNFINQGI